MFNFKRLILVILMSCSVSSLSSLEPDAEGCAYVGTRCAATISPWAAVGAVLIVATVVALAVNGSDHDSHSHSH